MRRPYVIIIAAVVLLSLGWTGYWFWIRDRIATEMELWIAARRAEGIEISDAGRHIGGFPLRIEIVVEQPKVAQRTLWSWSAPRLRAFIQPWNLTRVIFDLGPSQAIEWTEAGQPRRAELSGERALASTHFSRDGRLQTAAADLTKPVLTDSGLGESKAERLQLHLRANHGETPDRPEGSFGFAVQADKLRIPQALKTPLGSDIAALKIVTTLPPPLPPIDRRELAAWRDAGGVVNVDQLEITWGPLDASGNGTVTLDRDMRPLFSFGTSIRGFNPTVDAYTQAGLLKPNQATGLKMALAALAKPDAKGRPTAQMPIAGQDGRLYVGPFGVAGLPVLFPTD